MPYGAPPGTGGMYWVASASPACAGGSPPGIWPPGIWPPGTGAMYCVASASAPAPASGGSGWAYGWGWWCCGCWYGSCGDP